MHRTTFAKGLRFGGRLLGQLALLGLISVVILIGIIGGLSVTMKLKGTRRDLPATVTTAGIRRVRLGMRPEQVVRCLGQPYRVRVWAPMHSGGCRQPQLAFSAGPPTDLVTTLQTAYADTLTACCPGYRAYRRRASVELEYSRPVEGAGEFPSVGVRLDPGGRVEAVWVNHYTWFGDVLSDNYLPSYSLRRNLDGTTDLFQHPDDLRRLLGR